MFKVGQYLVYRRDVCKVLEINKNYYNNEDYYKLAPITDDSLTMQVPVNNENLRKLITKKEVEKIIAKIPEAEMIEPKDGNDKLLEAEYRRLLNTGDHHDLVKIIKTTYRRNQDRLDNNKKIGDRDDTYFKLAEQYLYNEFAVVLKKDFETTKKYVTAKVEQLGK